MAFHTASLVSRHIPTVLRLVRAYVAVLPPQLVGQLMEELRVNLPEGALGHLRRVRRQQQADKQKAAVAEVLLCCAADDDGGDAEGGGNGDCNSSGGAAHAANTGQPPLQDSEALLNTSQQQQQQQQPPATAHDAEEDEQQQQQQQQQYPACLPLSTAAVLRSCGARVVVRQVPAGRPDTRQQWQDWCQHWPMSWKPPPGAAEQQDGTPPTGPDQRSFEQHMAAALAASAAAGGGNVARIVDPVTGAVVVQALDAARRHPLDHAVMVAVEAVAARDRQLWPFNGFVHTGRHGDAPDAEGYLAVPTQHPSCGAGGGNGGNAGGEAAAAAAAPPASGVVLQTEQQQQQQQQAVVPALKRHKAVGEQQQQHEEGAGAAQLARSCQNGSSCAGHADSDGQLAQAAPAPAGAAGAATHTTSTMAAAAATSNGAEGGVAAEPNWSNKPYLCTGYDAFVLQEPCVMCAMALLHSRVTRVVYCHADTQRGALGGSLRLHAERSLNHHYLVYHMQQQTQPAQAQTQQQQQAGAQAQRQQQHQQQQQHERPSATATSQPCC